eukprot:TRINITY_DN21026_c0_g1_i1.p1 TRINITY_DN21026_c0_g1~~TRINITY_DN21026_c0_g1_i1.p1  ORF type:complete len:169 (-),score=34.21 TRINITY_DN21026_c0_g1_i1:415-921(-)
MRIRILPPNLSVQFDIEARAKSLRIYYLPFLISRLLSFLGGQEVRTKTYTKLNEIKSDTQDTIQAAFEGKKYNVLVTVESPVVLVPILKNNDPSSPIWCFKLGDIKLTSKASAVFDSKDEPVYNELEASLKNISLNVSCALKFSSTARCSRTRTTRRTTGLEQRIGLP